MAVVAFALIVVATVAMVLLLRKAVRDATARLEAQYGQALARDAALDKQTKALLRRQARVTAAAAKSVDATRDLHKQIQFVLCDPRVQEALDKGREVSANG